MDKIMAAGDPPAVAVRMHPDELKKLWSKTVPQTAATAGVMYLGIRVYTDPSVGVGWMVPMDRDAELDWLGVSHL